MSCTVDAIAWGEKNRVALSTGKTQEWVLARTTRDNPTVDSVVQTARAVMVKWFSGTPLDTQFADAGDAVDAIDIVSVSERMPVPSPADLRRESLDPIPMLASSPTPPLYVTVRFNYRGYVKTIPWPVWTASFSSLRSDKLCPLGCDWMLAWAKDPTSLDEAADELGLLDKMAEHGPGPLAGLAQLTQLLGWGLAIYAGVQIFTVARTVLPPIRLSKTRRAA